MSYGFITALNANDSSKSSQIASTVEGNFSLDDRNRLPTMAIAPHRGMGDLIICNALFRHFTRNHSLVVIPVKPANVESAKYMLRDVPSAHVVPALTNREAYQIVNSFRASGPVLFLGNKGTNYRREEFDRCFYEQAGIDFKTRWTGFKLVRDPAIELTAPIQPHAFVHDEPLRGFTIDRSQASFSGMYECASVEGITSNIFAWLPCILSASEIHCIDSSFALLIDSLEIDSNVRLFLHRYARPAETIPTYKLHWEYLS